MLEYSLTFNREWYLLLLVLLPVIWWLGYRSLSGLGNWRRLAALLLRSAVFALLVAALAELQIKHKQDRMSVIYVLDQTLSIPIDQREAMVQFVNGSIASHRQANKEDKVGVIVFGRSAEVEFTPVDETLQLPPQLSSQLDPSYTNLESALNQAMAVFPDDAARRIVVVTDGNQNLGDALPQARAMADAGVSIDVLPVSLPPRSDVSVEKLAIPVDVRRGQPFEMRVVLNNSTAQTEGSAEQTVGGTVHLIRRAGLREETLAETHVMLAPGKKVLTFRQEIDEPDFYSYEARFTPDDPRQDATSQNNRATAFTHVRGKGQVLVIEDWENPGEFDGFVAALRKEGLETTVQASNQLFTSLPELQRYDSVILANVPRSSGFEASNISSFSDRQIRMLVRNTEELGCGLVLLGGPNSFGAGGWSNTELEKAMPVNFQIKNAKVVPVGALVLLMHAGEIPKANYWQKKIAIEAIRLLGPRDYCGMIQWNGTDQWLWGQSKGGLLRVGPNRGIMMKRVDTMNIGDMPQFGPSMKMAATALASKPDAAIKHMIIISDGDPSPPAASTIRALSSQGVKVTTVTVGNPNHAPMGQRTMRKIASQTGGKHYVVKNAKALPRIYQREARKIARPLVYEPGKQLMPQIISNHEVLQGIPDSMPPITGFVLTQVKESPLVEVAMISPEPTNQGNATLMATWTYGLGKTAVLTTDAGKRWANSWTGWEHYDRLMSQLVRWSMRPTGNTGDFVLATEQRDGKTRVIIDAIDKDDQFVNVHSMTGMVVGPEMNSIPLEIEQVAPGRYIGSFPSESPGSYLITVSPGAGKAMIRTGVSVNYSREFQDRVANLPLLTTLAELKANGGEQGNLIQPALSSGDGANSPEWRARLDEMLTVDPFRRDLPKAIALQHIWPFLVLAGCCMFFADVFVRRIQLDWSWLAPVGQWISVHVLRRVPEVKQEATMQRLRSRKAEITNEFENRRASTRFETNEGEEQTIEPTGTVQTQATSSTSKPSESLAAEKEPEAEDSYTSRLFKAKRDALKKKKDDNE